MRIERIELRKILLPYVALFETSGWRERAATPSSCAWRRMASSPGANRRWAKIPSTTKRTRRRPGSFCRIIWRPCCLQTELASPWDVTPAFARVRGNRMAKAGLEFTAGISFARREGRSLASLLGRHARPGRGRRERGHPEGYPDAAQGRRRLSRRGLHAHQAQDQAGLGHRADAAPCARRGPTCCCRSTPTASITCPTPRTWPNSTPSTCC